MRPEGPPSGRELLYFPNISLEVLQYCWFEQKAIELGALDHDMDSIA